MNISKYIQNKIQQKHIDKGQIGGILSVWSQLGIYFGSVTFGSSLLVLYTVRGWDKVMPLYLFISITAVLICVISVFHFKYILPSQQQFMLNQQYVHNNPMVDDIKKIMKKLEIEEDE